MGQPPSYAGPDQDKMAEVKVTSLTQGSPTGGSGTSEKEESKVNTIYNSILFQTSPCLQYKPFKNTAGKGGIAHN